jgi:glucose uptake protein GlcU
LIKALYDFYGDSYALAFFWSHFQIVILSIMIGAKLRNLSELRTVFPNAANLSVLLAITALWSFLIIRGNSENPHLNLYIEVIAIVFGIVGFFVSAKIMYWEKKEETKKQKLKKTLLNVVSPVVLVGFLVLGFLTVYSIKLSNEVHLHNLLKK